MRFNFPSFIHLSSAIRAGTRTTTAKSRKRNGLRNAANATDIK